MSRKGVPAPGIRVDAHDHLLVPLRDANGKIWSLQTIDAEGNKHFIKGGRVQGLSATLGQLEDGKPLAVAEGLATAATIHQSTGLPVAIAFNSGNLVPVATAFRERYPSADIILAADNDHHLPRTLTERGTTMPNVGVEKALAATQAVNGAMVVPEFPQATTGSDWNDYEAEHGPEGVREAFATQLRIQGRHELANTLLSDLAVKQEKSEVTVTAEAEIATKPVGFGATNTEALYRDEAGQTTPHFDVKEGGIYQLTSNGGNYSVVPEPGLKLTANYSKTEGFGQLFSTPGIDLDSNSSIPLDVVRPAIVQKVGNEWVVLEKGQVAEAGRSNEATQERKEEVNQMNEQTGTAVLEDVAPPVTRTTIEELEQRANHAEQKIEQRKERAQVMLDALLERVETAEEEFARKQESRKQARSEPEQTKTTAAQLVAEQAQERTPAVVAEQREQSPAERLTIRGIAGQVADYAKQTLNDAREYYEKGAIRVAAILATPLAEPETVQKQPTTQPDRSPESPDPEFREAERSAPTEEKSLHQQASDLMKRVAAMEAVLFPGASVVAVLDTGNLDSSLKTIDSHLSRVESALGLSNDHQQEREPQTLSTGIEKVAREEALREVGYFAEGLTPGQQTAISKSLDAKQQQLVKVGAGRVEAWQEAATEMLQERGKAVDKPQQQQQAKAAAVANYIDRDALEKVEATVSRSNGRNRTQERHR